MGFPLCYAAYNLDEETRLDSSSGGVFSLLAEYVLAHGGIIYGAAFDDKLAVKHTRVSSIDELSKLRKSKYVQSEPGNCFLQVKNDLAQGNYVFFTGTPCQVAGLYSFLGEHPHKLLTADTVCMGVPSPKIYHQYLCEMNEQYGAEVKKLDFRSKSPSWQGYQIQLCFSNGKEYLCNRKQDDYMLAFSNKYILRPSCYQCRFKSLHHESDITLGDFWGIETICPEMHDDKGTSMVLVHSSIGQMIFEKVSSQMKIECMDVQTIKSCNPYLVNSVTPPEERDLFFEYCLKDSLKKAVSKFIRSCWLVRLWMNSRQVIHKIKVSCLQIVPKRGK